MNIKIFFFWGYTENSDAYLTNSERGIKGDNYSVLTLQRREKILTHEIIDAEMKIDY